MDYLNAKRFTTVRSNTKRIMNKVLSLGEAITDMLLHANTPLAVAYRKRVAVERTSEAHAQAETIASIELPKKKVP